LRLYIESNACGFQTLQLLPSKRTQHCSFSVMVVPMLAAAVRRKMQSGMIAAQTGRWPLSVIVEDADDKMIRCVIDDDGWGCAFSKYKRKKLITKTSMGSEMRCGAEIC